jgi:phosphatidylserine/phosphatidylglycerophosphate/cardiolipin synthase-like enzyme
MLLRLRDHQADPARNPREVFSVGVSQNDDGTAAGIAVTSARQPPVDDVMVRQTGAIAYALSALVDERIGSQQAAVAKATASMDRAQLDALPVVPLA